MTTESLDVTPVGYIYDVAPGFTHPNYLPPNGKLVTRQEYPLLFDALGHAFGGTGDEFALPDLRVWVDGVPSEPSTAIRVR